MTVLRQIDRRVETGPTERLSPASGGYLRIGTRRNVCDMWLAFVHRPQLAGGHDELRPRPRPLATAKVPNGNHRRDGGGAVVRVDNRVLV